MQASAARISFADLHGFSALFRDYCTRYEALAGYFAGDWRKAGERARAADRAAARDRDRQALADALLARHAVWGDSEAARRGIEALRARDTVAVVTGQQVGLFTGPMYAVLKAFSAIRLAERLAEETGRRVVPVFWLGGEDHDVDEISRTVVLRGNRPVEVHLQAGGAAPTGPTGRIRPGADVLDRLEEALPDTEFKGAMLRMVRQAYRPGATLSEGFARMLRVLFPELVLVDPDDAALKRLAAPLFAQEIKASETAAALVRGVSEDLERAYHAQVFVRPTNLFLLEAGRRIPLDLEGGEFVARGAGRRMTRAEALELLRQSPESFSPNVLLRPLMQDLLLPTAMYVGGPGEIAYFAQCRRLYEWAGLPMPLVYPRASATFLEPHVAKALDAYGLTVGDLAEDTGRLFHRVAADAMPDAIDKAFDETVRRLGEAVEPVRGALREVDGTLGKATDAAQKAMTDELFRLRAKAVRAEKKKQETMRARLEKAQGNAYPNGALQERELSVLHFLNKYGMGFLDMLRETLDMDTSEHQVVRLQGRGAG